MSWRLVGRPEFAEWLFPSSAHVYRLPAAVPIDEDAPTAARSVYAATKIASETMLQGYAADFGFSCAVGRLGNVYGNGASEDSVASIVLREVAAGRRVEVETLAPVRDFIYRDDAVAGLAALAAAYRSAWVPGRKSVEWRADEHPEPGRDCEPPRRSG